MELLDFYPFQKEWMEHSGSILNLLNALPEIENSNLSTWILMWENVSAGTIPRVVGAAASSSESPFIESAIAAWRGGEGDPGLGFLKEKSLEMSILEA